MSPQESLRGRKESSGTTESLIVYVGSKGAKDKGRGRLLRAGRSRAGLLDNFWSWKYGEVFFLDSRRINVRVSADNFFAWVLQLNCIHELTLSRNHGKGRVERGQDGALNAAYECYQLF